jgi:hypothetical protein
MIKTANTQGQNHYTAYLTHSRACLATESRLQICSRLLELRNIRVLLRSFTCLLQLQRRGCVFGTLHMSKPYGLMMCDARVPGLAQLREICDFYGQSLYLTTDQLHRARVRK